MVRYLAHFVAANHDIVIDLSQNIANGDLSKQDDFVEKLIDGLDLRDWSIVLEAFEALQLCDELADVIYDDVVDDEETFGIRYRICVYCQKAYSGDGCNCPQALRGTFKVVK